MTRIYPVLASLALALLAINVFVGLGTGDYNGESSEWRRLRLEVYTLRAASRAQPGALDQATKQWEAQSDRVRPLQRWVSSHMLLGVVASLSTLLVSSIAVTYFIGTDRWCREVVETYSLDGSYIRRSYQQKRRAFPWALSAMFMVLGISALGAASDPGTLRTQTAWWVTPHLILAFVGVAWIAVAMVGQYACITAQVQIIEDVMAEVHRVRRERGLPVEASELNTPS